MESLNLLIRSERLAVEQLCYAVAANSRDGSEIYCLESQLALRDSRLEELRTQMLLAANPASLPDGSLFLARANEDCISPMRSKFEINSSSAYAVKNGS